LSAAANIAVTANTSRLSPHQVLELTFQWPGPVSNPLWDVDIEVAFSGPTGECVTVGGFFYGSSETHMPVLSEGDLKKPKWERKAIWPCDPADLWKARFAPWLTGSWTYAYTFSTQQVVIGFGSGRFDVVEGRVPRHGSVRVNPANSMRLVFEDGTPYFPMGYQDCIGDADQLGSMMHDCSTEGPFRLDDADKRPTPPPGPLCARGPRTGPYNREFSLRRHRQAGFDLFRFSPCNCSPLLFATSDTYTYSLDHVRWEQACMIDELLERLRVYDLRVMYGIFGFSWDYEPRDENPADLAKAKRLVKYTVDRWGAYVDIWEPWNERIVPDSWYAEVLPYLRSVDPYDHPITTSWASRERVHHYEKKGVTGTTEVIAGLDIEAPHFYWTEPELHSDRWVSDWRSNYVGYRRPIIVGEQGNGVFNKEERERRVSDGCGGVWDPGSARRMRVRMWAALFNELHVVFWETSYAKDGHFMNIWIGPQERQYLKALRAFTDHLDANVRMFTPATAGTATNAVRLYGLASDRCLAVYAHHYGCATCGSLHTTNGPPTHTWEHTRGEVTNLTLTLESPMQGTAYWYSPIDAAVIGTAPVSSGPCVLTAPPFDIDIALLITAGSPPDVDRDGIPNQYDRDNDNDGYPNARDAFSLMPEEWADIDADRIGDNIDNDLDGDGKDDDRNRNGIADSEELDLDGDGVARANAIPFDAFPFNSNEWCDTDGDWIGDNADDDDDGDGWTDAEEREAGADPLSAVSFPD
jgi:hypothetical protein